MTMKLTKTKCAACPEFLAVTNTNPDGLCGECQKALRPGHARYKAWLEDGKPPLAILLKSIPVRHIRRRTKAERLADHRSEQMALRLVGEARAEVSSNHVAGAGLPPVDRLPLAYLAAAVEEFRFRVKEASKVSALARKFKV